MRAEVIRTGLRSALVLFSVFVLQVGLFDSLRIFDRASEPLLVLAIAGGLTGGPWRGLRLGFAAGLLYDLIAGTPLGLAAFGYALAAYLAGLLEGYAVRMWWLVPPFSALGLSLYVAAGEVFGQDHLFNDRYLLTLAVVEIWATVLAPAMLRVARWLWHLSAAPARPAPREPRTFGNVHL